eukprot:gene32373-5408_t
MTRGLMPVLASPSYTGEALLAHSIASAAAKGIVKPGSHVVVVQRLQEDFCLKVVTVDAAGTEVFCLKVVTVDAAGTSPGAHYHDMAIATIYVSVGTSFDASETNDAGGPEEGSYICQVCEESTIGGELGFPEAARPTPSKRVVVAHAQADEARPTVSKRIVVAHAKADKARPTLSKRNVLAQAQGDEVLLANPFLNSEIEVLNMNNEAVKLGEVTQRKTVVSLLRHLGW